MHRPRASWGAFVALGAAGSAVLFACSSTPTSPAAADDAGARDATTTVDASVEDSSTAPAEDSSTFGEDASDGAAPLVGMCEPVQGPACDLVLQDCPASDAGAAQECLVTSLEDGGNTVGCFPVTTSEHLPKGHGCCPSDPQKECDPGLECIGDPSLPCDGGVPAGRCTPHCCGDLIDGGDDYLCGASVPEGFEGHCDSQVVDQNGDPLFNACTYLQNCEPFGVKPCPSGYTCQVQDVAGVAGCENIFVQGSGSVPTEGQACVALNNCADGLVCLEKSDGTAACAMMCLTPGSVPPFDAGALDGGPFAGGCPTGEQCNVSVGGFPGWLSFCGATP